MLPKMKMSRGSIGLSAALVIVSAILSFEAQADLKGTDFDLAFPSNSLTVDSSYEQRAELHIRSDVATSGVISGPAIGSIPFVSNGITASVVTLPPTAVSTLARQTAPTGIHVHAQAEVLVTAISNSPGSAYSFAAWPTDAAGTDHVVLAPPNYVGILGSGFLVVATAPNTQVTLTPGGNDGCPTVPLSFTLQAGQTYFHQSCTPGGDASKATVHSTAPVTVISTHDCGYSPSSAVAACDAMAEVLPPINAWRQTYDVVSFAQRSGDLLRIMALNDGTTVSFNGTPQPVLAKSQILSVIRSGVTHINASGPVLVAQIANGAAYDNIDTALGDPALTFPTPAGDGVDAMSIHVEPVGAFEPSTGGYVNVAIAQADAPTLTLDSTTVNTANFTPVPGTTLVAGQVPLSLGTHHLSAAGPFTATAYSFGDVTGVAFQIDRQTPVVTPPGPAAISLTPNSQTLLVGTTACISATVRDGASNPLSGQSVAFGVSGANPSTGTRTTDSNGAAQYCFTGSNSGKDTINASVSGLSANATVTWNNPAPPPASACIAQPGDVVLDYRQAKGAIFVKARNNVRNVIFGSAYGDTITGGNRNDCIDGGGGNDTINAGNGDDIVFGGEGNDKIQGGAGNDILYGGSGNDSLAADDGADTLNGGGGIDTCKGDFLGTALDSASACETLIESP